MTEGTLAALVFLVWMGALASLRWLVYKSRLSPRPFIRPDKVSRSMTKRVIPRAVARTRRTRW